MSDQVASLSESRFATARKKKIKPKASKSAVNWSFAVWKRWRGDSWLDHQLALKHDMWNECCAGKAASYDAYCALRLRHCPEIGDVEAAVADLDRRIADIFDAISRSHQTARRKSCGTPEQRAAIAALKAERKPHYARLRELKESIAENAAFAADHEALKNAWCDFKRELRHRYGAMGCHSVAKDTVGEAIDKAAVQAGASGGRPVPRFRRWPDRDNARPDSRDERLSSGSIRKQIQDGLTWEECLAGRDNRLKITVVDRHGEHPDPAFRRNPDSARSRRRATQGAVHAVMTLTFGTAKRGQKLSVPIVIHRPLPPGAKIVYVFVKKELLPGNRPTYSVTFTLQDTPGASPSASGVVAVDWNHRVVADGLRVASWLGDDGDSGELILPRKMLDAKRHAEEIQSIRDLNREAIIVQLAGLKQRTQDAWFQAATPCIEQWRSCERIARLHRNWIRFEGDAEAYQALTTWVRGYDGEDGRRHGGDWHYRDWSYHEMRKIERRRLSMYRDFAVGLARKYGVVVAEKVNHADMQRRDTPIENTDQALRFHRKLASPGLLHACLAAKMKMVRVNPMDTSKNCHACGKRTELADQRVYVCEHCGAEWDCDDNARRNLLARGEAAARAALRSSVATDVANGDCDGLTKDDPLA